MKHYFDSPIFLALLGAVVLVFLMGGMFVLNHIQQQKAVDTFINFAQEQAACRDILEAKEFTFAYPCSWIVEKHEKKNFPTRVVIQIHTDPFNTQLGNAKYFFINTVASFEAFEAAQPHMDVTEEILTLHGHTYQTKLYSQHGGRSYVINLDGSYIEFGSEDYFYQEQNEWDEVMLILESLEMK